MKGKKFSLEIVLFISILTIQVNCECKSGCIVCREDDVCTKCAPGYALPNCDQITTQHCVSVVDDTTTKDTSKFNC